MTSYRVLQKDSSNNFKNFPFFPLFIGVNDLFASNVELLLLHSGFPSVIVHKTDSERKSKSVKNAYFAWFLQGKISSGIIYDVMMTSYENNFRLKMFAETHY